VRRRTYQEITALLLSGQLDGAWVCDDPYVQHEDQLACSRRAISGEPLYQTYVAVNENSRAQSFDDLGGTIHAFSDPDSTSGYLVTRYLLAMRRQTPASFFREFFSPMAIETSCEPSRRDWRTAADRWLCLGRDERTGTGTRRQDASRLSIGAPRLPTDRLPEDRARHRDAEGIAKAFLDMGLDPLGQKILATLKLDGFVAATRISTARRSKMARREGASVMFLIASVRSWPLSWKAPLLAAAS